MTNIFRQAYEIITTKKCEEMTDDEIELVGRATSLVATQLPKTYPEYDRMPISEGLLKLAEMIERG